MDQFKALLHVAQKQKVGHKVGFSLIALITAGGEYVFSSFAFKCPCNDWNFIYGTVSLLVPALALLILSYIVSNKTWKLFTGLCLRRSKLCRFKYACGFMNVFLQITVSAIVAPVSWISIALLKGNYFECAMTGIDVTQFKSHVCENRSEQCHTELPKFPCGRVPVSVPQSDREAVLATFHVLSQILGWILIASIMMLGLLLTCVARCNSPVSHLQLKFWRAYAQKENEMLESHTADHAQELAERNLESFFEMTKPDPLKTPSSQAWQKVSNFYKFRSMDQYYSVLHKYVETRGNPAEPGRNPPVKSDGGEFVIPAALAFIDESHML